MGPAKKGKPGKRRNVVALMCPMKGCKEHEGMCIHEKLMLVMAVVGACVYFGWRFV